MEEHGRAWKSLEGYKSIKEVTDEFMNDWISNWKNIHYLFNDFY